MGGLLKLSQILKPSHAPDIPRIYQPCKKDLEVVSNSLRFSNRLTLPISLVSTNPAKRIWRSSQTVSHSQTVSRPRYPSYLPTLQKGLWQASQTVSNSQTVSRPRYPASLPPLQRGFGGFLKLSQILKPSHAPDIPRTYQPCIKDLEVVSNCLRFSNRLTLPISLVSTNPAIRVWQVVSNCLKFSNRLTPAISLVSTNPAKRIWRSSQTVSNLKPSHAPDIPPYRRSGPQPQRSIIV